MPLDWLPDGDELLILPVENVAMYLLGRMARRSGRAWHVDQFTNSNGEVVPHGPGYRHPSVVRVLNEAWDWLYVNGLIVGHHLPGNRSSGYCEISRRGLALVDESEPLRLLRAERLLTLPLHAAIGEKARILFGIGEYEAAVLMAFRELEIRVRNAGSYPSKSFGPGLMRDAFNPTRPGPLTDLSLNEGERSAIAELYAGAMGAFKNPLSHRTVDYDDPTIAAEQLIFADLLHRMLDGFIDLAEDKSAQT
jgi:uncharacterized protein (TIGR02391 family)